MKISQIAVFLLAASQLSFAIVDARGQGGEISAASSGLRLTTGVALLGNCAYNLSGGSAIIAVDRVRNQDVLGAFQGAPFATTGLRLELWAFNAAYVFPLPPANPTNTGVRVAAAPLAPLPSQGQDVGVIVGPVGFSTPVPAVFGTPSSYHMTVLLTEYRGPNANPPVTGNDGYAAVDYVNFSGTFTVDARGDITIQPGPVALPPFFNGATAVGGGFEYLNFSGGTPFGYFAPTQAPIIYHNDLGFLYLTDAGDYTTNQEGQATAPLDGIYFYGFSGLGFVYTTPALYPYLYSFNQSAFLYYFPGTSNPRVFYNFGTQQYLFL